MKILELFGGIGACSKALERIGIDYEIADYVEIDKYAVKSYNAIHNTNFEPQDIKEGVVLDDLKIRKLTPKECWRLMGFDDTDFDKAKQVNSDTQLYKQAGNSIVVNVLEEILKKLVR